MEKFMISVISKNSRPFLEKHLFFLRKPNFWTFWQFSRFQSHSTATLKVLELLKISRLYRKIRIFFRKPKLRIFWGLLLFQLLSTEKVLTLVILKSFVSFFSDNINFFEKTLLLNFQCLSQFLQQAGYF